MLDLFDFSNEMLAVADTRGYMVRLNAAWTETLGWSAEELLSRPYIDFVHPDDIEATVREAELLWSGKHQTISFEHRWLAKDGSYRWLTWYAKLDPESKQLVGAARDITEQRLKAELLQNLIQVAEQEKQFICHEFHDGLIQYAVGYLFLSCGQWAHYHQPTDTPDRLNYAKMARICEFLVALVGSLAEEELPPNPAAGVEVDTAELEIELLHEAFGPALPLVQQVVGLPRIATRADLDTLARRVQRFFWD